MSAMTLQQKLADKLWSTVFGGEETALLPPWQLRQEKQDHTAIRDAELAAIDAMLADLNALERGQKILNHKGELVDAPVDELAAIVKLNPLIERAGADPLDSLRVPSLAKALEGVRREADIRALRHSLNVRRIGLRADKMAEAKSVDALSERPVDPDWLLRWQENAGRAVAADFQDMWASVLVDEVRQPGTHSLRTLAFLATISKADLTIIRFVMRLNVQGFVCFEAEQYFQPDIHEPMLLQMVDMGLLEPDIGLVRIRSVADSSFRAVLRSHDKALYIEGDGRELAVKAQKFTALGGRISTLFGGKPDTGYLFALGNALKKRQFRVEIGDWLGQSGGGGLFSEKMSL